VQYPGRLDRIAEPGIGRMARMVEVLRPVVLSLLDRPVALFEHSLGASIAFEVARRIEQQDDARLLWVVVSGRPPPDRPRPGNRHLDDDLLWQDLCRLGGVPEEILDYPGVRAMAIGAVRTNYRLIETYRPTEGPPLTSPLAAWLGTADPEVTEDEARVWAKFTGAEFELRMFDGDHFYFAPARQAVVGEVVRGVLDRLRDRGDR